ncbi:MAG: hypothetical protein ACLPTJ_21165 [Solirubrobacteraceae bacterium]
MSRGRLRRIALIACKFAVGTIDSITGWYPTAGAVEIFLVLGLSFAAQNLSVARRTITQPRATIHASA